MKYIAVILAVLLVSISMAWADEVAPTENAATETAFSPARSQSIANLMNQKHSVAISPSNTADELASQSVSPASMIQGLILVIGIFFVGIYAYKKFVVKSTTVSSRRIRLIERNPVTAKTSLVLAEIDGRRFAFAIGSERVTAIDVQSDNSKTPYRDEVRLLCADDVLSS